MKKILGFVFFLIAIFLGSQYFIPSFIEHQIEEICYNKYDVEKVNVKISTFPAYDLFFGDIDKFDAKAKGFRIENGLRFEEINLRGKNIKYSLETLLKSHKMEIQSLQNGEIEGVLLQEDVNNFLQKKVSGLQNSKLTIENNRALLIGEVNIAGIIKGKANIKGNISLNNNCLIFSPLEFSIGGINILGLNQNMLNDIIIYNFNNFPIKVKAYKIVTENGKLHIFLKPEGI